MLCIKCHQWFNQACANMQNTPVHRHFNKELNKEEFNKELNKFLNKELLKEQSQLILYITYYIYNIICIYKWSESHSLVSDSLQPHDLYSSWNSLGQNTGVGNLSLLQGIFQTQGLNPGFLHCRWILYHWVTREASMNINIYILYFICNLFYIYLIL